METNLEGVLRSCMFKICVLCTKCANTHILIFGGKFVNYTSFNILSRVNPLPIINSWDYHQLYKVFSLSVYTKEIGHTDTVHVQTTPPDPKAENFLPYATPH